MAQEGQIVRNKTTGAMGVIRNGQVVPVDQQAPANPVIAPPDPYKQAAEQRSQAGEVRAQETATLANQVAELTIQEKQRALAEEAEKERVAQNAQEDAKDKLTNVIGLIDDLAFDSYDNDGWFETGTSGALTRNIPGTAAYDLAGNVKTIDANAAFNALAEMRQNSPTGGALGQVTEKELDLLKSSVANLDTAQSQAQFFQNLAKAKKIYLDMLARLDPAAAESFKQKRGIRFNDDGSAALVSVDGPDEREPIRAPFLGGPGAPPGGGGGSLNFGGITQRLGEGAGSIVEGVGDVLGIVTNPIGQFLYDATGYGDQRYDTGQILREAVGLPDNPIGVNDTIIKGGAAALTGSLAARGAASLAAPGGVAQNALSTLGRTPMRDTAAGAGAGAGMEAGRASGIPGGEAAGLVLGGIGGYTGASGVNSLVNTARGAAGGAPNALAQAATRQGVDLLPADAGGPVARAMTTGTKASPLSVAPVVNASQRQQQQMGTAANRVATSQAEIGTTEQAGQSIRAAAERFTQQTSQRASRLYDRANEASRGVLVKPLQTLARLDEHIARLHNDPSAPESAVAELSRFRDKIANGVTVSGLRDARTRLSQGVYDGKLRSNTEQGMWKDILGNLSSDIDLGLKNAGRGEAAAMFRRADDFWKQRVEHIDQVLQPILGRDKGGEQIVQAIEAMARGQSGGNARLSRLLAEMTPGEAGQVRATIIDRLGKANPGAQGAEGNTFSASTFLNNWNKMTPQAHSSLFSDAKLRENLTDIAQLAEGMKTSQSMANFSNTGVAVGSNAALGVAAFMAHPVVALLGAGAQFLTGKLMASPGFARILAKTAKMPPEAASRSLREQLGVLAARDGLIANDVQGALRFLEQSAAQSPGRLAAAEQEQD